MHLWIDCKRNKLMDVTSFHSLFSHLLTWVFKFLASLCLKEKRNSRIFLLNCILSKLFNKFLLMVCSCVTTNCTNIVYYVSYSTFLCYNPSHHVFLVTRLHHYVWTLFNTFHSFFHCNVMPYIKFEFATSHYSILLVWTRCIMHPSNSPPARSFPARPPPLEFFWLWDS
jgi:hypothetical protein